MAAKVSTLARLRLKAGLEQQQLADQLGVHVQTIKNWEGGKHEARLSLLQVKTLCNLLETPLDKMPDGFTVKAGERGWLKGERIKQITIMDALEHGD